MRTLSHSQDITVTSENTGFAWAFTRLFTPRVMVRTQDTQTGGFTRLKNVHDPLSPATPWAMHLADESGMFHRLVLDLDAKNDPARIIQVERDAEVLVKELSRLGIHTVVCESSNSGGLHVWLAPADPITPELALQFARAARAIAPSVDIVPLANPKSGAVRPPYSPHTSGGVSRPRTDPLPLLEQITTVDQVSAFVASHYKDTVEPLFLLEEGAPSGEGKDGQGFAFVRGIKRALPPQVEGLLRHGHPTDASAGMWSILLSAAHAHWRFADVVARVGEPGLLSARTRSGGSAGRRPRRDVHDFLARQWARAVRFVSAQPRRSRQSSTTVPLRSQIIAEFINAVFVRVGDDDWFQYSDEHGAAALRVFAGLCVLTQRAARFDIAADVRRLAELTGMSRATVARSLHALRERGYIFLVAEHSGTRANVWSIRENVDANVVVDNCETQGYLPAPEGWGVLQGLNVSDWLASSTHDAFWGSPTAANQYGMAVLVGNDVEVLKGSWGRQYVGKSLDEIARLRGTTGVLLIQKLIHETERVVWSWWCEELEFLRKKADRIFHNERQEWITGKRPMARERFPRVNGRPDFTTATRIVNAELGGF